MNIVKENIDMPQWLKNAVFYEIYPQSFYDTNGDGIGDINGITQKLDYIKQSGFNALWLNPCYLSPFMDAGYDVQDYKQVAPRYGTNEDLYNLFDEAHKRGMHVILTSFPGTPPICTRGFGKQKNPRKTSTAIFTSGRTALGADQTATRGWRECRTGTAVTCSTFSTVSLH